MRSLRSNDIIHTQGLLVADIMGVNMEIEIGMRGVKEWDIEEMWVMVTEKPNATMGGTLMGGIIGIVAIAIIGHRVSTICEM